MIEAAQLSALPIDSLPPPFAGARSRILPDNLGGFMPNTAVLAASGALCTMAIGSDRVAVEIGVTAPGCGDEPLAVAISCLTSHWPSLLAGLLYGLGHDTAVETIRVLGQLIDDNRPAKPADIPVGQYL